MHLESKAAVLLNVSLHFSIPHKMHSALLSQQIEFFPHFSVHKYQESEVEPGIMIECKALMDDHMLWPMNKK